MIVLIPKVAILRSVLAIQEPRKPAPVTPVLAPAMRPDPELQLPMLGVELG